VRSEKQKRRYDVNKSVAVILAGLFMILTFAVPDMANAEKLGKEGSWEPPAVKRVQ